MQDENDREYVHTNQIPEWMASALGKLVPVVLISALGSSLFLWRDHAVLRADFESLQQSYADHAVDCASRRSRIDGDHYRLSECIRRLERLEDKVSK